MEGIYLDHAATTPLSSEVYEAMVPYFTEFYGNPSSTHSFGRKAKVAIEESRKIITKELGVQASNFIFTSGGTESNNTVLKQFASLDDVKTLITSPLEHHAVLHVMEELSQKLNKPLLYIKHDSDGSILIEEYAQLISQNPNSLVSIMYVNNEIGTINDIQKLSTIAQQANCYFHCDMVQALGKIELDLSKLNVTSASFSSHKIYGPKGIGGLYFSDAKHLSPLMVGGKQEKSLRAGTENVPSIVGFGKAVSLIDTSNHSTFNSLKSELVNGLNEKVADISINGSIDNAVPHIVSIALPEHKNNNMLLFTLDLQNIAVSGGSACSSGALQGSHVINSLGTDPNKPVIRFSFGKQNSKEQIQKVVRVISDLYQ